MSKITGAYNKPHKKGCSLWFIIYSLMSSNNYNNIEIELLVKLCISKNKYAEKELIARSTKFIERTIRLYDFNAIDQESKEDLIQDVLIKILTKIEFYEFDNSSFYNWVYILTQNAYLDVIRKKKEDMTL